MMTIDDYRLLAMTPSQAHREKRILEKSAENRQKSAEIGRNDEGNDGDDTRKKEGNTCLFYEDRNQKE